ncbi:L-rhamnose mutarotase [Sphingomonas sp. A2-49]|uniref:L-rhamnose mutarotase n=1 Tax=Sphingomonas sp. A2-49 TaxID=1391375 RepID=UPI0021D2FB79|nr:L-rhamnose mutarotase [Sphingomonas sp. A2-49]MCU6454512.1 L-rhamnose mutarotase [Sphingomonas sp. A2-49]
MGRRICFALDLVDDHDLIAAYERAHAPGAVWAEVIEGIRASGIETMEIWRVATRLFMIAEVADDWPRPIPDRLRVVDDRWQATMDRFQQRIANAADGGKWAPMTRIFALDAQ